MDGSSSWVLQGAGKEVMTVSLLLCLLSSTVCLLCPCPELALVEEVVVQIVTFYQKPIEGERLTYLLKGCGSFSVWSFKILKMGSCLAIGKS